VAERGYGAYQLPLVGPFDSMIAAIKMWDVVDVAMRRVRPDLADCSTRPAIVTVPRGGALPRGRLDLTQAVDDDWIKGCIYGRV
jgi:hypothetical protein